MSKIRTDRINEEIEHAIAEIIPSVKDPRIRDAGMISVTHADTAGDLSVSKIYLSVFSTSGDMNKKEFMQGLKSCTGFIRKELGIRVKLRVIPELTFILDDSLDRGAHVIDLIQKTVRKEEQKDHEQG